MSCHMAYPCLTRPLSQFVGKKMHFIGNEHVSLMHGGQILKEGKT